MELWRLIYISEETSRFTDNALTELVARSRRNNDEIDVNGLLLYSGGSFMQVLEGDRQVVTQLFEKIAKDPRHTNVIELSSKAASRKLFDQWGMHLANANQSLKIDRARVEKRLAQLRSASAKDGSVEKEAIGLLQEFRQQLMKHTA